MTALERSIHRSLDNCDGTGGIPSSALESWLNHEDYKLLPRYLQTMVIETLDARIREEEYELAKDFDSMPSITEFFAQAGYHPFNFMACHRQDLLRIV